MQSFRVTIVDDRKSVLQETEIQLNAIESLRLKVLSRLIVSIPRLEQGNILHIYGMFNKEKKLKIPDMSKQ